MDQPVSKKLLHQVHERKQPLNQNKMEFALGVLTGMFIMFIIAKRLQIEWKKQIEKLKDFDTWKEWKNNPE